MVTASREARRMACTRRPKLCPSVARRRCAGVPCEPTPRARRAMPMVCHSSAISPTSRMAARVPRTKRCGSFAFWARASARSVGSVQLISSTAGRAIASPAQQEPQPQLQRAFADGPDADVEQDLSGVRRQDRGAPAAQRRRHDQRPPALPQQRDGQAGQREEQQFEGQRHGGGHPVDGQRQHHGHEHHDAELGQRIGPGEQGMVGAQGQCFPHGAATSGLRGPGSCAARFEPGRAKFQLGAAQDVAELLVVGHGHHGRAGVEEFGEEGRQFRPGVGVLAERGLIEDQHPGMGGQDGGDGQPALLAA